MARKRSDLPTIADHHDMVMKFHEESDRAAGLLAGAFVEHYTETYLRAFILKDRDEKGLFQPHGPLDTFSARISIAYAFGLIDESLKSDLDYIRKVRNYIAHEPMSAIFSESPLRDYCQNLSTVGLSTEPREQYLFAVGMAVGRMHNTASVMKISMVPKPGLKMVGASIVPDS